MKIQVVDLFAGIGGFTLGLSKTKLYETKAFCEWDQFCQQVLRKNFPDIPIFGDIKELNLTEGYCDVLTGGFPCQDISYAGKGEGLEGSRSNHYIEYIRLIKEIKPKGVIIENVSALRTRGLGTVLSTLDAVGYDAEWHCLTASSFGASHQRDRTFILAYHRSKGRPGLVPFQYSSTFRQGGWSGKESLQQIFSDPFRESNSWPKPLICRTDVPLPRRVDRLKQLGNTVYWPIVEQLGYHMYNNLTRMKLL